MIWTVCWLIEPIQGVKTEIGEPIDGAVDFTRELAQFAEILILSARFSGIKNKTDIETMKNSIRKWLDQHKFSYTEIWTESAKPPAQAYIDDHGRVLLPFQGRANSI